MTHTKGPWEVNERASEVIIPRGTSDGAYYAAYVGTPANARLIAAAPEQHEFIERIANVFRWDDGTVEEWREEARALLQKVEGE